ncbi:hypothetical protein GUA46_11950 [Muricauda sp. HICW]|uniref:Uncharacterized protein n=1 Tax=Flagellimonas chongwuensis TaxID=2697365 RepID=A0A850NIP1_9FLAO|nr:hypothetical protein [Allomuricauda chongwuensis]NVN19056.1 hypothetical protein [Allomuricauda chongwuensis]
MKSVQRNLIAVCILMISATGLTKEPSIDLTISTDSSSLLVESTASDSATQIRLLDAKEETIHRDEIVKGKHQKKYILKHLKAGTYYFKANNSDGAVTFTLELDANGIHQISRRTNTTSPNLRVSGQKVYLSLLNKDKSSIKVKICNSENKVIDSQVVRGELAVGRIYNFQSAYPGDYTVIVEDGTNEYRKTISVR